ILFGENVTTPGGVRELVRQLQAEAAAGGNPPLLVAIDQEGGAVRRLPDGPPASSASMLGRTADAREVERQGAATGAYLRRLGLTVDLAPVADVADARRSFLGSRVFGDEPGRVASLAGSFAVGLQSRRVRGTVEPVP